MMTPKKQRFVDAYLVEPNATKAAIAAGYSAKTATQAGSRLLTDVDIRAAIGVANEKRAAKAGVSAERVIAELAKIGFSDIRKLVRWRSNVTAMGADPDTDEPVMNVCNEVVLTDSHQIDDDTAGAISEISQSKEGALKVKLHDKLGALDKLGKHLGLFAEPEAPPAVVVIRDLRSPRKAPA